jgi:hypothetical protein
LLDVKLIAARWYLGELAGEDMPEIARQALELGHDGKHLRGLAGLISPTRRDVAETVDGALRELGVQSPIAKRDAAFWMAKRVASEIVEGRIEPYRGACCIWLLYGSAASELQDWSDLVIKCEVAAETGGVERAKQQIVQAAKLLLARRD